MSWDPFGHSEGQFSLDVKKSPRRSLAMGSDGLPAGGGGGVAKELQEGEKLSNESVSSHAFTFTPFRHL